MMSYSGFTFSVMVTTLSQPWMVCNVVVLVPAAVNTLSFQVSGKSLWQMVLSTGTAYVGFTVSVIVTTESQPWIVWSVVVWVPAAVKVTPFHTNGSSLSHTVSLSVTSYTGFTVNFSTVIESQPFNATSFCV